MNMNLRQYKKLCKKALPLALALGAIESRVISACGDEYAWFYSRGKGMDPLKGTKGFGFMSGGYEPEWEDQSAYSELKDIIFYELSDWSGDEPKMPVILRGWRDVFRHAKALIQERKEADDAEKLLVMCEECSGTGETMRMVCYGDSPREVRETCSMCDGEGAVPGEQ